MNYVNLANMEWTASNCSEFFYIEMSELETRGC